MRLPKLRLRAKFFFGLILVFLFSFFASGVFWINLRGHPFGRPEIFPLVSISLLLFFLVAFLLISLRLSKQILSPLEELKKWSDYVGLGNLNERLRIKTGDEIEELANSFNLMASSMEGAIKGLEKSREEILIEKNKLATVIYSITDGVVAIDSTYNIILFNKAAETLTGFKESEVLGKPVGDILKFFKENQEITVDQYCPTHNSGSRETLFEDKGLELQRRDKKKWYVDLKVGTIHNDNISLGCILTLRDVTPAKELEAMKLDFVTMTAHELRTPLTAIKGYLSILREPEKLKGGEQEEYLDKLAKSTERLGALVENVLNIAKIEQGGLALNLAPIKLPGLIQEMISEVGFRAQEKQIEIIFDKQAKKTPPFGGNELAHEPVGASNSQANLLVKLEDATPKGVELHKPTDLLPEVKADKLRIGQVILNLLSNAIHYTNPGGKVRVWIEPKEESLVTHVQDTGIGIPEQSIPHLFTKFYRVPGSSLVQQDKGTGLGLYITKSIIDMHKGKIWVKSEVGKGSRFSFSLPIFTNS